MVAYASQSNNQVVAKYNSYEGECLVVVRDVATFQCYWFGSPFTLVTDHKPLKWLMEFDLLTGKLARWAFIFQEYNFDVKHLAKIVNKDVNGLNRNSIANELDTTKLKHIGMDKQIWKQCTICTSRNSNMEFDDIGSMNIFGDAQMLTYLQTWELDVGLTFKEKD